MLRSTAVLQVLLHWRITYTYREPSSIFFLDSRLSLLCDGLSGSNVLLVTPDVSSRLLSFCHFGCMKSLLDKDSCQRVFAEECSFSSTIRFSVRRCICIVCGGH